MARTRQLRVLFLCHNEINKEEVIMFSDEILEKIFTNPDVSKIPIEEQVTMIRVIEKVLDDMEVDNATISKS